MRKVPFTLAACLLISTLSWSWGRDGHRIIAPIAEDHLDETTKVMIQSLIGNNHLYSVSNWADDTQEIISAAKDLSLPVLKKKRPASLLACIANPKFVYFLGGTMASLVTFAK